MSLLCFLPAALMLAFSIRGVGGVPLKLPALVMELIALVMELMGRGSLSELLLVEDVSWWVATAFISWASL